MRITNFKYVGLPSGHSLGKRHALLIIAFTAVMNVGMGVSLILANPRAQADRVIIPSQSFALLELPALTDIIEHNYASFFNAHNPDNTALAVVASYGYIEPRETVDHKHDGHNDEPLKLAAQQSGI